MGFWTSTQGGVAHTWRREGRPRDHTSWGLRGCEVGLLRQGVCEDTKMRETGLGDKREHGGHGLWGLLVPGLTPC